MLIPLMSPLHNTLLSTATLRRRFLVFAVIYVMVWLTTWYGAKLVDILGGASLWFLPAGLRFSAFLLMGWPAVLAELVAILIANAQQIAESNFRFDGLLSVQMFWLVYDWCMLPLAYAAVIFPLRWRNHVTWNLTQPIHSLIFLSAALLAAALGALVGTVHLVYGGIIALAQWLQALFSWFIGDLIGIITVAPLLLVRVWPQLRNYLQHGRWSHPARVKRAESTTRKIHPDCYTVSICMLGLCVAFGLPYALHLVPHLPLFVLLLLLPLAGLTLCFGLKAAVLAVVVLDSGLVLMLALFDQQALAIQYQLVMMAIALVGLWLGGAVGAKNRLMVRYKDFARVSNDLLWETNQAGCLSSLNGRLAKHLPISIGQPWRELLGNGPQPHLQALEQVIASRHPIKRIEIALNSVHNEPRWIEINALPVWDESGELAGYRGTATDITRAHRAKIVLRNYNKELLAKVSQRTQELHQANEELKFKKRHLQVLLAVAPVGVLEFDDNSRCRYLNTNGGTLTGRTPEQALGRHLLDFVHPDDRDRTEMAWTQQPYSNEVQWLEFRLSRSNLWCSASWIKVQETGLLTESGTIVVLADATLRHQQQEQLWTLAHHDALTNLPNRNLFWDRCAQALSLAKRHKTSAVILWIDLDGFKAVNDELGHAAGDVLLQQVSQRLKNRIRSSDTVARMGGDEFAVIMPDISKPEVSLLVANELLVSMNTSFELPQGTVHISGSIGLAYYPEHAQDVETLTKNADMAMYAAKHTGKNQIQIWNDACFSEKAWSDSSFSSH